MNERIVYYICVEYCALMKFNEVCEYVYSDIINHSMTYCGSIKPSGSSTGLHNAPLTEKHLVHLQSLLVRVVRSFVMWCDSSIGYIG